MDGEVFGHVFNRGGVAGSVTCRFFNLFGKFAVFDVVLLKFSTVYALSNYIDVPCEHSMQCRTSEPVSPLSEA